MIDFKTVVTEECFEFENKVNELLKNGYKILHTSGGVVNHPWGSQSLIYQAFLLKVEADDIYTT